MASYKKPAALQPEMVPARRRFLTRTAAAIGGGLVTAATLDILRAHGAQAATLGKSSCGITAFTGTSAYGPLSRLPDQRGVVVLALPKSFRYITFSHIGSPMSDGSPVPLNLDGMAAFRGPNGTVRLIRNHEVRNAPGNRTLAVDGPTNTRYDPLGVGGCVTVDFVPNSIYAPQAIASVVNQFVSLNGTIVNCAGGLSYRDTGWITCEETVAGPNNGWQQKHGYAFLVPASANSTLPAVPLTALGRFSHEASVADARTGIVYQTEDAGNSAGNGFYRFLPNNPDNLLLGGSLQMLRVVGQNNYDTRKGQAVGRVLPVDWVTIGTPDPNLEGGAASCFNQGAAQGGANFNRLEGIFRGENSSIYFVSTTGGDSPNGDVSSGYAEGYGQLWQYTPCTGGDKLVLIYESAGRPALDSPDNICVTPKGSILFCEDDAGNADEAQDTHPLAPGITNLNRVIGLAKDGLPFEFAVNCLNDSEFAGACFSPDGKILFVNIFGDGTANSGMTCAITGPWAKGPL